MEIAARLAVSAPKAPVAMDVPVSKTANVDWQSTARYVEAAVAQITFTAQEIEGILALDDPSWRSIGGGRDE